MRVVAMFAGLGIAGACMTSSSGTDAGGSGSSVSSGSSTGSTGGASSSNAGNSSSASPGVSSGGASSGGAMVGRFEPRASLGAPRQETAVVALGEHVYILGGFDDGPRVVDLVERYSPALDAWEARAPLPMPLHHINAAALDGRIYVTGALAGQGFTATGVTLVLDPVANTWSTLASMPAGTERGASVVGVYGRRIHVAGGYRAGSVADVSIYDVDANTWSSGPALPAARDHMAGGVVGNTLVVAGGRNGALTARVDLLNLDTLQWTAGPAMPTARAGTMGAVLGTRLYVLGGEGNRAQPTGVFDHVESLEVAGGQWTTLAPMMPGRHGTGAATLNGVIHVPGGATREGFGAVATHTVFVP